jgi:hypothetical protein
LILSSGGTGPLFADDTSDVKRIALAPVVPGTHEVASQNDFDVSDGNGLEA